MRVFKVCEKMKNACFYIQYRQEFKRRENVKKFFKPYI